MTLDEAIKHCEEVADGLTEQGKCKECAEEHRQLAEWLKELKQSQQTLQDIRDEIVDKRIPKFQLDTCTFDIKKRFVEYNRCIDEVLEIVDRYIGGNK